MLAQKNTMMIAQKKMLRELYTTIICPIATEAHADDKLWR